MLDKIIQELKELTDNIVEEEFGEEYDKETKEALSHILLVEYLESIKEQKRRGKWKKV